MRDRDGMEFAQGVCRCGERERKEKNKSLHCLFQCALCNVNAHNFQIDDANANKNWLNVFACAADTVSNYCLHSQRAHTHIHSLQVSGEVILIRVVFPNVPEQMHRF